MEGPPAKRGLLSGDALDQQARVSVWTHGSSPGEVFQSLPCTYLFGGRVQHDGSLGHTRQVGREAKTILYVLCLP